MTLQMQAKDDTLMRLVHYFITEENYNPMVVNGVKDEIWLQSQTGPYKIIRINANYIHNKEQYEYDVIKLKNVMRQVKRKTLSLKMNALNILLDVNDGVPLEEMKDISSLFLKNIKDIKQSFLLEQFPGMLDNLLLEEKGLDLIFDVTNGINKKTEKENKMYEKIFKQKKIVITPILITLNIVIFFLVYILSGTNLSGYNLLRFGGLNTLFVQSGEFWRLFTCAFLHGGILHLLFNMYSLYLIGTQLENVVGKWKFLAIYIISILSSSLMSCVINPSVISVGASGAIFGLLGAILYFGYQYRLYLGSIMRNQIIPLIFLNLFLGFVTPGIDNAAHIGGLIGGLLVGMALGVQQKEEKKYQINGCIVLGIYIAFLGYLLFWR